MPSEKAHVQLAVRNQITIEHLLQDRAAFSEWIATVAFYKALHVIEAVFSRNSRIGHGRNHEMREYYLKTNKQYEHIYRNYRFLQAASTVARYLKDGRQSDKEYTTFADYMPPDKVVTLLLDQCLDQVQKSAVKFLSAEVQTEPGLLRTRQKAP